MFKIRGDICLSGSLSRVKKSGRAGVAAQLFVVFFLIYFHIIRTDIEDAYKQQQSYNKQIIKVHNYDILGAKIRLLNYYNVKTPLNIKGFMG